MRPPRKAAATRAREGRSGIVGVIDQRFEKNVLISSVDYVFNWARKISLWPLTFGLAWCAIEMIASTTARFDMARFGAEVVRPSPRQAVFMLVSVLGTADMGGGNSGIWRVERATQLAKYDAAGT